MFVIVTEANEQDLASCQRQCELNSNCYWFTRFIFISNEAARDDKVFFFQLCRPVLAVDGLLLSGNLPGALFSPSEMKPFVKGYT